MVIIWFVGSLPGIRELEVDAEQAMMNQAAESKQVAVKKKRREQ